MTIDLSGYASDLEDSTQKLNELGAILDNSDDLLESALNDLNETESNQDGINQALRDKYNILLESLSKFHSDSESLSSNFHQAMERFDTSIEAGKSKLSDNFDNATALISNTQALLSAQESEYTTSFNEIIAIIEQFRDETNVSIENTLSAISLLSDGVNVIHSTATEANDDLINLMNKISSNFDAFVQDFLDSLRTSSGSAYDTAIAALTDKQTSLIEEPLLNLSTQLKDGLNNFDESCTSAGEEMIDNFATFVSDSVSGLNDDIQQQLRDSFQEALENTLDALLVELGTTMVTMAAGSSVSAVMAPIFPAMKTVGEVLETINDGLDIVC